MSDVSRSSEIERELAAVLNRHSIDSACDTPDFILAAYLMDCLRVFNTNTRSRDRWWGWEPTVGQEARQ